MFLQLVHHHIFFPLRINISNAEPLYINTLLADRAREILQFNCTRKLVYNIPVVPNDFLLGGIHQFRSHNIGCSALKHIKCYRMAKMYLLTLIGFLSSLKNFPLHILFITELSITMTFPFCIQGH